MPGQFQQTATSASSSKHLYRFGIALTLIALIAGDWQVISLHPWQEVQRMLTWPNLAPLSQLLPSMAQTVAFAILGVMLAAPLGLLCSHLFHWRWLRGSCAFLRAIHELFWALLLMQIFGLHPLTGLLAIAIPYTGTFAKVYAEIIEEHRQPTLLDSLPGHPNNLSKWLYGSLMPAWPAIVNYTQYRFECGLRSSALLGFIGLPTLGFQLESAFQQGDYHDAWGWLLALLLLIGLARYSWRWWILVPLSLISAVILAPWSLPELPNLAYLLHDLTPSPLRQTTLETIPWPALTHWLITLWHQQAWPGLVNTWVLSQVALVLTGLFSLVLFTCNSSHWGSWQRHTLGGGLLTVLRSIPEYMLTYVLLLLWGPSMLPALLALSLHNGAIIGTLNGRHSDHIELRADASQGFNRYAYEILPRVYTPILALLFYRWEVIMRETAILGILGVHTLGFYIDSAFEDIRLDTALILILITALLNMAVDSIARRIRHALHLRYQVSSC